jgi:hypothetical protein
MKYLNWEKDGSTDQSAFTSLNKENSLEKIFYLAAKDLSYRPQFYELLLSENLVALGPETARPSGEYEVGREDSVLFSLLSDGRIPIFTSIARIFDRDIVKGEVQYFEMKGRDLLKIIPDRDAIINPFSECSKELTVLEMHQVLNSSKNMRSEPLPEGEVSGIILPANLPNEVTRALTSLYTRRSEVVAAYFGKIKYRNGDILSEGYPFLGVEVECSSDAILHESGEVLREVLPNEPVFDLMDMSKPLGKQISAKMRPFYQRGSKSRQ